jgi:hypothetical protein
MATTTPNYGWTVPTSTDLVKDGATAIETLGDAIDASMNTALGTKKAGMVLLNTTSFSGVSSQSINDVFSATYDHYQIVVNVSGSGFQTGSIRLRVSGADDSNAVYDYAGQYQTSASTIWQNSGAAGNQTSWLGFNYGTNGLQFNRINIYNPFSANRTLFFAETHEPGASSLTFTRNGQFRNTTSFTGISFIQAGGTTFTGSIQVYGLNK